MKKLYTEILEGYEEWLKIVTTSKKARVGKVPPSFKCFLLNTSQPEASRKSSL